MKITTNETSSADTINYFSFKATPSQEKKLTPQEQISLFVANGTQQAIYKI